ncbi:hypothetical protein HPNQ4200_0255 [Helicobacter pylori NQ4200]|uniref:Uncharacterized protein n=1 Tax=Helicobacter pylori NQ4200 TaxID=992024 RepID=J0J051_HELPX|nr:hypothetical protein HPNQ4200_0255 [Helicobacter pylori NQ4200]
MAIKTLFLIFKSYRLLFASSLLLDCKKCLCVFFRFYHQRFIKNKNFSQ